MCVYLCVGGNYIILSCVFVVTTDGSLLEIAARLNTLLANENERLRQLTDDLKQKHSHMTSEVRECFCELEMSVFFWFLFSICRVCVCIV